MQYLVLHKKTEKFLKAALSKISLGYGNFLFDFCDAWIVAELN